MAVQDLLLPDIFEEAFEMAGQSFSGGYDVRRARRALSLLMDEWGNRGLNLWTIEEKTISLVVGTDTYTLPTDTIDLIEHVIRTTDGLTDFNIRRIGIGQYARLAKKQQQSRPTIIYVERLKAPQVTLWPIPDRAYTLVYWCLTRLESIATGIAGSPDAPSRFRPALTAGIALRLARVGQRHDLVPDLALEYEKQFKLAADEDRDRSAYHITPLISI